MAEMSVRQWQERFRSGDFNSRDLSVQCEAGWYDWFCRDEALAGRLKKLSSVVLGIKAPFILDNYPRPHPLQLRQRGHRREVPQQRPELLPADPGHLRPAV